MTEEPDIQAIGAQARLHHAYFLVLQLMISTGKGPEVMGDWMFRLVRRQHLDKFLSSFDKPGLSHLPVAVACTKYQVLSNGIGDAASADVEGDEAVVVQAGVRVLRSLEDEERGIVLACWAGLGSGAMRAGGRSSTFPGKFRAIV